VQPIARCHAWIGRSVVPLSLLWRSMSFLLASPTLWYPKLSLADFLVPHIVPCIVRGHINEVDPQGQVQSSRPQIDTDRTSIILARDTPKQDQPISIPERQLLFSTIMFFYILFLGSLLLKGQFTEAAAFTTTPASVVQQQISKTEPIQISSIVSQSHPTPVILQAVVGTLSPTSLPPIPRVTSPPSLQNLELRQRCWNDQGFSIDCAVWTGYRYSWGPSSNPYDYWSGGGTGSGGGGVALSNDARKAWPMRGHVAILLATSTVLGLFGMSAPWF
jgi:hypothetical protein